MVAQEEPGLPQSLIDPVHGALKVFFKGHQLLPLHLDHDIISMVKIRGSELIADDLYSIEQKFRKAATNLLTKEAVDQLCTIPQHIDLMMDKDCSKLLDLMIPH